MPIIPTVPMSRAHVPTDIASYPWRFRVGSLVYIVGRPLEDTFTVVGGELVKGCPHYHVSDDRGRTWRIPQLHCSSKPVTYRKG